MSIFYEIEFAKLIIRHQNDRSSSKTDCVGLGEEKCLRDPRGSRMGKEKGFRKVPEQAAVGLGEENSLRDPSGV